MKFGIHEFIGTPTELDSFVAKQRKAKRRIKVKRIETGPALADAAQRRKAERASE